MAIDLSNIQDQRVRDALTAMYNHSLNCLLGSPELAPGSDDTDFQVSAFHYKIGGVAYYKAAADDIAPPGASTTSGQFRKVLLSIDTAGAITATAGAVAASQAAAVLPDTPDGDLPIAYLELPASFTSGSTSITSGMCKPYVEDIDFTP